MKKIETTKPLILGFSLAEALITLLIVCIITLASVPVITKKHRQKTDHGKWMCTLNSQGQHVVWAKGAQGSESDPDTWAASGTNYCKFNVPASARNFAITISAAGGGGAGASTRSQTWNSDFAVQYPGMYNFLVIGGGGHGGGSTDKKDRSAGGGAGAVVAMKLYLSDKVSQIRMQKGAKGGCCQKRDGTKNSGYAASDGNHSKIIGVMYNDSGILETKNFIVAEGGDGGHGGEHGGSDADRYVSPPGKVYFDIPYNLKYASVNGKSYTYEYKCYGKYGNVSCSNSSTCSNDVSYCSNRMWGIVLVKSSSDSNKICHGGMLTKTYQTQVNNFFSKDKIKLYPELDCTPTSTFNRDYEYWSLSSSQRTMRDQMCAIPGLGGGSKQSRFACGSDGSEGSKSGSDGYVLANTTYYLSGGGGQAGDSQTNIFYPQLEAKYLKVSVGQGGSAGVSNSTYATNGSNGGDTYIETDKGVTLAGKKGGLGGTVSYTQMALMDTPGGNGGVTSIYYKNSPQRGIGGMSEFEGVKNTEINGLKSYGYGDGGGGGGINAEGEAGNGADGSNGIVIIEW